MDEKKFRAIYDEFFRGKSTAIERLVNFDAEMAEETYFRIRDRALGEAFVKRYCGDVRRRKAIEKIARSEHIDLSRAVWEETTSLEDEEIGEEVADILRASGLKDGTEREGRITRKNRSDNIEVY